MSQQEQLNQAAKPVVTPMLRLHQRVQELLSQVKADRQQAGHKLASQEVQGLLLVLLGREVALESVLVSIDEIQNGSEDPNKVLDFLGADELPAFHDSSWRED